MFVVCLFCRSGCSGSEVASNLAFVLLHLSLLLFFPLSPPPSPHSPHSPSQFFLFRFHPPDPLYELRQNKQTGEYFIELFPEISSQPFPNLQTHRLQTKSKSMITLLFFPIDGAHYTIIFSHGNATDCGAMFSHFVLLASSLKCNVIGYDYTGYGPLGGTPTERQVYYDIEAVYNWCSIHVTSDPGSRVILYGQSVGSGPSCYLASRQPVAGLILHSPILSGVRVLTTSRLLACCDIFPNIDRIKKVRCPVFVIHGMVRFSSSLFL